MKKKTNALPRVYMGIIFAFLYLPIVILIIFSFNAAKSRGVWAGFSLKWYAMMLKDEKMISSVMITFACGILAAVISTVIGTISAIGLYNAKKKTRSILLSLSYIPMLNAEIVTGISLMMMYTMFNMRLGFVTLLLSHITFCIPYVILTVLPKVKQFEYSHYIAALDLGATPAYAFRKIVLPDLMPGIVAGFLLAFTFSIDDFIISFMTTGNGINNLSITIYTMTKRGINPEINAVSTIVFAIILMLLIAMNIKSSKKKGE